MPIQYAVPEATALKAKEIKFQLPTLTVVVVGKWIWVSGETFPARATLVAMGLRFSKDKVKWYFKPEGRSFRGRTKPYGMITAKYGEMRVDPLIRMGA
jgi:hypothetical protein